MPRRASLTAGVVLAVLVAFAAGGCGADAQEDAPALRAAPAARQPAPQRVAVVWGADDLPAAARRLRRSSAVAGTSVIRRGTALLRSAGGRGGRPQTVPAGYAVPLDVVAVDPRRYAAVVPAPAGRRVARLRRGEALLSQTSARLRRIGEGGRLTLVGGHRLRVAGVVPDSAAQAGELLVHAHDHRVATEARNVIVILRASSTIPAHALARRAGGGAHARLASGGGPHGAGPARPAELKARFGEPRVRLPYGDDWVQLDPGFLRRQIVTRRVPVLGSVTCHRRMLPALRGAMTELRTRGLARLVDPGDYAGCHTPRRIRPGGPLSLHAWGLAVDLNASRNPFGAPSRQDARLVRTMQRHGFSWGGDWPTARDPMHFEFRGR